MLACFSPCLWCSTVRQLASCFHGCVHPDPVSGIFMYALRPRLRQAIARTQASRCRPCSARSHLPSPHECVDNFRPRMTPSAPTWRGANTLLNVVRCRLNRSSPRSVAQRPAIHLGAASVSRSIQFDALHHHGRARQLHVGKPCQQCRYQGWQGWKQV